MHDGLGRLVLDRHLVGRQQPRDVDERLARQHDRPVALDLRGERRAQRELHVGGRETQLAALTLEQDPGQDLHRGTRRDRARHDTERSDELVLGDRDPQPAAHYDFSLNHLSISL